MTLSLSRDGVEFDRHFAVRHGVQGADIDHGGSCPRYKGAAKGCGYQYPGASEYNYFVPATCAGKLMASFWSIRFSDWQIRCRSD